MKQYFTYDELRLIIATLRTDQDKLKRLFERLPKCHNAKEYNKVLEEMENLLFWSLPDEGKPY